MADISKIKLPNNSEYDVRDRIGGHLYPVKGTQTAKTGTWTGAINVPALYDGLTIAYYLPYAGDGNATLNLTLSDGVTTTGAINVYYTAASRMTTHYGAGSTILLTYWSAGSISVAGAATTDDRWTHSDYDSTNTYRLTNYYGYYKAYTVLYRYQICLTKNETSLLPINTVSNSTATTKTLTTENFNPFGPIFYYASTTTVNAGNNIGANTLGYQYLADLRYSFNTGTSLTAARAVYLVAELGTGCSATLASTPISQTLPNAEDGYIYIYLGQAYDNYRIELSTKHPIYRYINGVLRVITSDDVVTVNGYTVEVDVPSDAKFTDTVTTINTSGSGNAITSITASNGALTATKGTTFLTSHQDISGKADKATTLAGYGITDAYTKIEVDNKVSAVLRYKGVKAAVSNLPTSGNTIGDVWHVTATSGEYAWDGSEWQELGTAISIPANTGNSTTGISIANHGTGTVIGVQSTTTTASKVTLGTAISVPNVTGNTDITVPIRADDDVTVPKAASSATTVPIKNANATTIPTAASSATTVPIKNGSATSVPVVSSNNDATLSFAMDTTDTKKLKISWSATPTRTVFGTAASIYGVQSTTTSVTGVSGSTSIYGVQSSTTSVTGVSGSTTVRGVKTGDNSTTTASKVTLGTAKSIPNVTAATDVTVPIKNTSSSTFVTGNTHSITDNGHTHTI